MLIIRKFLKILVGLFSAFGIVGFSQVLPAVLKEVINHRQDFLVFLAGIVLFTLFWFLYFIHRGNLWSNLEHELTHALFATLFLKKVHSISASRKRGGVIAIDGGNSIIALSPYFFPLAAIVVLLLKFLVPTRFEIYFIFLLGMSYQFHLINLFREFNVGQSDIRISGYLFSIILIAFLNLVFLGIILVGISGNYRQILHFLKDGLVSTFNIIDLSIHYIYQQIFADRR